MAGIVKFWCGLLLALLIAFVGPLSARVSADTQQQPVITISPTLQKLNLGPGLVEAKTYVQVTNSTNHRYTATVKLVDFKSLNENGGLTLGQVGIPLWQYGLAKWMQVSKNTVSLAPGQTTRLEVTIQNSADLTPGGHYGAVIITGDSTDKTAAVGNQVNFSQNLVSLLFVKKLGGEKYGLQLLSMAQERGHELPQSVTTDFRSTGNVYVIPRGYITITDPRGKIVEKGTINENSTMILQGTHQKFITLMEPIAHSSVTGRYKITAYYRYEGQTNYDTKTIYFNRSSDLIGTAIKVFLTGVIVLLLMYVIQRVVRKKYSKTQ